MEGKIHKDTESLALRINNSFTSDLIRDKTFSAAFVNNNKGTAWKEKRLSWYPKNSYQ